MIMMKTYYYLSDIPESITNRHIKVLKETYGEMIDSYTRVNPSVNAEFYSDSRILVNDIFDLVPCKTNDNYNEIFDCYHKLIDCGTEVKFVKSPQCNSDYIYNQLKVFGVEGWDKFEALLKLGIDNFIEFNEHEKQRRRLHFITAQKNGVLPGNKKGDKLITKKSVEMKAKIKEMSKEFDGKMTDVDIMKELGIARNTYYKYKKEIKADSK